MRQDLPQKCPFLDSCGENQKACHRESYGALKYADRTVEFVKEHEAAIIAIPRNLFVVPGKLSRDELIRKMGTGIHLTYSLDEFHSTNTTKGTFSIPCGVVYYENGIPKGRVQQMTVYGNFKDLFCGIEAAGNDLKMKPIMMYQSYCYGGPSLLVRGLDFSM